MSLRDPRVAGDLVTTDEEGARAFRMTWANKKNPGSVLIEHIPSGTAWSTAAPTVTASTWIYREDYTDVLIALDTDATGGNLTVQYSNDAGVNVSNITSSKAITSAVGATITSKEGVVPAAGSAVTELVLKEFAFFRVQLTSGAGTSTTAAVNVRMVK